MAVRRRAALLAATAALLPLLAHAQTSRVPTVTRLVKLFLDLEAELLMAQRDGDARALEDRIAMDFEMRVAARPGQPIPRADWLRNTLAHKAPAMEIEQMAVHDEGQAAVASFLLRPHGSRAAPLFIVDTWVRNGDDWRLQVRYAAPVPARSPRVMGEGEPEPVIPKRY
jgi:hypothetical protein